MRYALVGGFASHRLKRGMLVVKHTLQHTATRTATHCNALSARERRCESAMHTKKAQKMHSHIHTNTHTRTCTRTHTHARTHARTHTHSPTHSHSQVRERHAQKESTKGAERTDPSAQVLSPHRDLTILTLANGNQVRVSTPPHNSSVGGAGGREGGGWGGSETTWDIGSERIQLEMEREREREREREEEMRKLRWQGARHNEQTASERQHELAQNAEVFLSFSLFECDALYLSLCGCVCERGCVCVHVSVCACIIVCNCARE